MKVYFLELPDWHFDAGEVSAGVYRITGVCRGEARFEKTGADTTALLEECHRAALEAENAPRGGED